MDLSQTHIATDGKIVVNHKNASNGNIITTIHKNLPAATKQVKDVASHYRGKTDLKTARNIFDFLKTNIRYKADGENQDIKLPGRFVASAVGDCKSYSLFTAAILNALKIPFAFRYVSYWPNDSTPQHVYVVANPKTNPIVIDAVNQLPFNHEKPYTFKHDYIMQVRTISGTQPQPFIGGWLQDQWNKVKDVGQEVIDKGKTALLAAPRGAYLLLLNVNAFGFSSYLNKLLEKDPTKLKEKWNSLGGNFTELKNAINNGRGKKPIFNKNATINGVQIGSVSIAAGIAAASAIIAALAPLLAEAKKLFGNLLPEDPEAGSQPNQAPKPPNPPNQAGIDGETIALLGTAALALYAFNS